MDDRGQSYSIGYKDEYFEAYMDIAGNKSYKSDRQMVVWLIGKSKREEARQLLIEQMNSLDLDVILHTLSALNYFRDDGTFYAVRAFTDCLISEKGRETYIKKAVETYSEYYSLSEYRKTDVQQSYRALLKEANKILACKNAEVTKEDMKLFERREFFQVWNGEEWSS